MKLENKVKIRLLIALLLLMATALGAAPSRVGAKDATGCSYEGGRPIRGACSGDEGSCYVCWHSDGETIWECGETADGSIMVCRRI